MTRVATLLLLLLTLSPVSGAKCQPAPTATCTAYCLKGHTTSGPRTTELVNCIALSRKLATDLGLKIGKGQYDYNFWSVIEVIGVGKFTFCDLMPRQWTHYRVDIYCPTLHQCRVFGVKRCQVRVVYEHKCTGKWKRWKQAYKDAERARACSAAVWGYALHGAGGV